MTEPNAPGVQPNETAGLQIHKVLSRGAGPEAQVLLVLLSAPVPMSADEDIWVGIGITEAQSIFAQDGGDSIEVARSITNSELAALDLEARVDKPPFSLVDVPGRGYN